MHRVADRTKSTMSTLETLVCKDTFLAMGNTAQVTVVLPHARQADELLNKARLWIDTLERSWSRFIPTSDIHRLNQAGGRRVRISPETAFLIRHLLAGYEATGGLFNPFLLPALIAAGYGVSMSGSGAPSCPAAPTAFRPTPASVELSASSETMDDPEAWCRLLDGTTLDPGGLGKGLAADIVVERLIHEGALGALVSLGGDIRCDGQSPTHRGWTIGIERIDDPTRHETTIEIASGAIATSTTHAKRWAHGHHIINPATSQPLDENTSDSLRMSSVVASSAVWAEIFATASLIAGAEAGRRLIEMYGLSARFESVVGAAHSIGSFQSFESRRGEGRPT